VREKAIIVFLVGFMILIVSGIASTPCSHHINGPLDISIPTQTGTPITVIGNTELSQISSGGVGTRSEPYLISGLTIISAGTCINIQNTTAFFAIQNCNLESTVGTEPVIQLSRVENGLIQNCYVRGGSSGASLQLSVDCIMKESVSFDNFIGIPIYESDNCTILDCKIFNNFVGISIDNSNGSIVINSSIYSNSDQGLSIGTFSDGTTIYRNNIGWNGINAYNNGNNTEFTNGIDTGNAWSDYSGVGVYEVAGSNPSSDSFATILIDVESPSIDSPLDKVYDVDSYGETLTWVASEEFPYSYLLYINDIPQDIELWDGRAITISLDALPAGAHTLIMTVRDGAGNVASDEVEVTAVSFMFGGIGTELVIWGSALTVAILILVVVIIKKMP
jgi:parallel beta-helix repeat protein